MATPSTTHVRFRICAVSDLKLTVNSIISSVSRAVTRRSYSSRYWTGPHPECGPSLGGDLERRSLQVKGKEEATEVVILGPQAS
jgi:hypothetical protein